MGSATPLVRSRSLLCLCLLLLMSTLCDAVSVTAGTSGRSHSHSRRRSGGVGAQTLEEQSDSVPDQLALAGRTHTRRGSSHTVHHSRSKEANNKDYAYGQVELNLVRPDSEALYPSSLSTTSASDTITLEDSQSAAEYVANAIKLAYKQPQIQMQQPQIQMQQPQLQSQAQAAPKEPQATSEQPQRDEERERQLLELHMQKELQAQQQAQQAPAPVYEKEPVTRSYELYEQAEPSTQSQAQAQSGEIERQYRTKYYNYVPYPATQLYRNLEAEAEEKVRVSASTEIPKSEIMKQIEKSVIKYMKELEAEGKILSTPQEQSMPPPLIKTYYKPASASISVSSTSPSSATVGSATALSSLSDEKRYSSSTVRPKYTAAPGQGRQQQSSSSLSSSSSSSSYHHHHPSGHHHQPQQQQHQGKLHPLSHAQAKPAQVQHFQSETETAYQAPDLPMDELSPNVEFIYKIKTRAPLQTATVKTVSKPYTLPLKNTEHFDHGAALKNIEEFDLSHVVAGSERERERERERDRDRETGEELLHHHQQQQQHQHQHQHTRATNGKPHKLYFNSEIYHDINSLPFKGGDKGRHDPEAERVIQEYRHKLKAATGDLHPDYKGYTGYFAEPDPDSEREEREQAKLQLQLQLQLQSQEDGYPIVNPYPYLLKKEPLGASKYEDEHESWAEQPLRLVHTHGHPLGHSQSHAHAHAHAHGHAKSQHKGQQGQSQGQGGGINSSLEYDSYSPRFNNNPEGYGYQHTYKGSSGGGGGGSVPAGGGGKRGKRGGSGGNLQPNPGKKQLRTGGAASAGGDLEASLALRPPPKK
ncbi:chromatin modification-related protein eaf-1 [Drosophila subobscura]|uniref:chromatin modification-related protein eaf-1 n=1 Tax=Drosophila subobscura TaxID=7241 RepID=UPI00155A7DB5|nr:chromatin modification-related protein eaf-1 [Drosophila subobscura]